MQTQREGKNILGVSVKGGKGTQRKGKRKKSNLSDRAKRYKKDRERCLKKTEEEGSFEECRHLSTNS